MFGRVILSLLLSVVCLCERNNLTLSECLKPLTGGRGEDTFKNEIVKVYGSLNNTHSSNR